jgi:uncharacterized RDD family membrane protein YckC
VSSVAELSDGGEPVQATRDDVRYIGVTVRVVSWVLGALLINLAVIIVGLGTALVLATFPVSKSARPDLQAIAGVAYVVWCAAYFVVFWSTTGQTPGARVMQIRLVTGNGQKVNPAQAIVRWVGMNLAMLPLFAGYLPILFRRRGFPDWLAHTLVLDTPPITPAGKQYRRHAIAPTTASGHLAGDANRESIYEAPGTTPAVGRIALPTDQRQG